MPWVLQPVRPDGRADASRRRLAVPTSSDAVVLGRGASTGVKDPRVSRRHASARAEATGVRLTALGNHPLIVNRAPDAATPVYTRLKRDSDILLAAEAHFALLPARDAVIGEHLYAVRFIHDGAKTSEYVSAAKPPPPSPAGTKSSAPQSIELSASAVVVDASPEFRSDQARASAAPVASSSSSSSRVARSHAPHHGDDDSVVPMNGDASTPTSGVKRRRSDSTSVVSTSNAIDLNSHVIDLNSDTEDVVPVRKRPRHQERHATSSPALGDGSGNSTTGVGSGTSTVTSDASTTTSTTATTMKIAAKTSTPPPASSALSASRMNGVNVVPQPQPQTPGQSRRSAVVIADEQPPALRRSPTLVARVVIESPLEQLLSMFPDADPAFLLEKLAQAPQHDAVMLISNAMIESGYPKVAKSSLVKAAASGTAVGGDDTALSPDQLRVEIRKWRSGGSVPARHVLRQAANLHASRTDTGSAYGVYGNAAINWLMRVFPYAPKPFITMHFARQHGGNLIAAFRALTTMHAGDVAAVPYTRLKRPRAGQRTGLLLHSKFQAMAGVQEDDRFAEEMCVLLYQAGLEQEKEDARIAEELNNKEYEESGQLIECQCCFDDVPFDKVTTCSDGHLFCLECGRRGAETLLGDGKSRIGCFANGCKYEFPQSEIRRFLPEKSLKMYFRRLAENELREAGLENLVDCPFCNYAAVVDNPDDRVFICRNPECGKHSCRLCREESHIPLRCNEVEGKAETQARRQLEEKMTNALLRTCYQCKRSFFKESGCNHMTCSCGAHMCYLCRAPLDKKNPYGHFKARGGKCELWDNDANQRDVAQAAQSGLQELQQLARDDSKIDLARIQQAVAPPPLPPPHRPVHNPPPNLAMLQGMGIQQAAHGIAQRILAAAPNPRFPVPRRRPPRGRRRGRQ